MEFNKYLDLIRRRRRVILVSPIVVAVVAWVASSFQTPEYRAQASVLLLPNDPAEHFESSRPRTSPDPNSLDRFVAAQIDVIESEAIAQEAAQRIGNVSSELVQRKISVSQRGSTETVMVSATDPTPGRASLIANSVVLGYIEHRRREDVASVQRTIDGIDAQLRQLLSRIARLERAASGGADRRAGAQPEEPGNDVDLSSPDGVKAALAAAVQQYQSLYAHQQELMVELPLKQGGARLIAEAKVPQEPFKPQPARNAALGAFAGVAIGLATALLRDQLADPVRSSEEVADVTGLPILAELPFERELTRRPRELVVHTRPDSRLAEAIRSLRTSLQVHDLDGSISMKSLLVTSPGPGEGTSLVAGNLAILYAEGGRRTVMVSADLRRPRLEEMFGAAGRTSGMGLSGVIEALSGRSPAAGSPADGGVRTRADTVADALIQTGLDNLFLLPAGTGPENPADVLGSPAMAMVLDELASKFDVVIIDSPPVLPVTDAVVLSAKADAVVLLTVVGETGRRAAGRATAILREGTARLVGAIVNKVTTGPTTVRYADRRTRSPEAGFLRQVLGRLGSKEGRLPGTDLAEARAARVLSEAETRAREIEGDALSRSRDAEAEAAATLAAAHNEASEVLAEAETAAAEMTAKAEALGRQAKERFRDAEQLHRDAEVARASLLREAEVRAQAIKEAAAARIEHAEAEAAAMLAAAQEEVGRLRAEMGQGEAEAAARSDARQREAEEKLRDAELLLRDAEDGKVRILEEAEAWAFEMLREADAFREMIEAEAAEKLSGAEGPWPEPVERRERPQIGRSLRESERQSGPRIGADVANESLKRDGALRSDRA